MEVRSYAPEYFKDKKITVMGLGLLGRGIGDVKFLAEEGAHLIVTDLKSAEELAESLAALKKFKNITYVLGKHQLEDFRNRDFILKAAGVPQDSIYLKEARTHEVPIYMSTSLFAALTPATIVGVTGTRGKSTVTHLLFEVLRNAAAGSTHNVFLGGNVKGVATLPFLREAKKGDMAVLELDSWQLQGFGEEKLSPHISIFTTLYPDHLNYYKGDMDAYLDDKANIFKFQKKGDCLIVGSQVAPTLSKKYDLPPGTIIADAKKIPTDWKIRLRGEHNLANIALVVEVSRVLGVPEHILRKTVEKFKGVSGRLEHVRTLRGIEIYNDTTATSPDATIAALKALAKGKRKQTILIMGGADKGLDMEELLDVIPKYCKLVLFLPGTGSVRIKTKMLALKTKVIRVPHLEVALEQALEYAKEGDSILLSPAFASFGQFKNEFDRGEQFNALVGNLR